MKHCSSTVSPVLRAFALAAACFLPPAWADDYGDISQLLRAGKVAEAMAKVEVFLAAKPRDPQLRFYKGVIQRDTGKVNDAIVTFTKLTEDYPELPEPYNNLAVLYAGQNQFDKARASLEMAIRTNPSYATAHENLGDVYAMLASQAYNKALQLDKGNAAVPPKLALIRELFSPAAKQGRPAASAPAPGKPVSPPAGPPPATSPATGAATAPATVQTPAPAVPSAPSAPAQAAPAGSSPAAAPVAQAQPKPAVPAASAGPAVVKPAAGTEGVADVEQAVAAWAKAWSAKDVTGYLAAYGKDFDPAGKQSRSEWEAERRKRIAGKSRISVKIDKLTVTVTDNQAVATFRQEYRADALSVSSRKTLDFVKSGDRWLIVRESTGG